VGNDDAVHANSLLLDDEIDPEGEDKASAQKKRNTKDQHIINTTFYCILCNMDKENCRRFPIGYGERIALCVAYGRCHKTFLQKDVKQCKKCQSSMDKLRKEGFNRFFESLIIKFPDLTEPNRIQHRPKFNFNNIKSVYQMWKQDNFPSLIHLVSYFKNNEDCKLLPVPVGQLVHVIKQEGDNIYGEWVMMGPGEPLCDGTVTVVVREKLGRAQATIALERIYQFDYELEQMESSYVQNQDLSTGRKIQQQAKKLKTQSIELSNLKGNVKELGDEIGDSEEV
jgi:hypothetical protein